MKRSIHLLAVVVSVFGICGCANVTNIGPGGASPGSVFSRVTYPNALNPNMQYRITFDADDIVPLGIVTAQAKSKNILGVAATGDSGYGKLLQEARYQYKDCDGVMNVTVDTEYMNVLFVYYAVSTKLSGLAYKYKR